MTTHKHKLLLAAFALLVSSGCTARAYCDKVEECASDPPGAEFTDICTTRQQGALDALRANSEEECIRLAAAQEALMACRAQLDCDDFTENDLGGKCDDELDDYEDALNDAADGDWGGTAVGPGSGFGGIFSGIPRDCSSWD